MRPLKLSPADQGRYLAEMRKIRFTAQELLHRISASDPVSLAHVRAMLFDADLIIVHLERAHAAEVPAA